MTHILYCHDRRHRTGVTLMLGEFTSALRELGCTVEVPAFDLDSTVEEVRASITRTPDLVIAPPFNLGFAEELRLDCPHATWLVDHPLQHNSVATRVLVEGSTPLHVFCIDRAHVKAMGQFMHPDHTSSFLPHCASGERGDRLAERPIPILFAGRYISPQVYREAIDQLPRLLRSIAHKALDFAFQRDWASFEEASHEAYAFDRSSVYVAQPVCQLWDRVLRSGRRQEAIEALLEAGLPLEVVGHGWEESPLSGRLTHHEPVHSSELPALYRKAQVVLNMGTNLPSGSHERVFSAQLAGAAVVTEQNDYWQGLFTDELMTFRCTEVENLPAKVRSLLDHDEERLAMADRGQRAVLESHLWRDRAAELLTHLQIT